MAKFARAIGIKVKEASQKVGRVTLGMSASAVVVLGSASSAFAATPSTGNTDIDDILTEFFGIFDVAKLGFKALAIASVVVTLLVIGFFWLRGKLKQSVAGA